MKVEAIPPTTQNLIKTLNSLRILLHVFGLILIADVCYFNENKPSKESRQTVQVNYEWCISELRIFVFYWFLKSS